MLSTIAPPELGTESNSMATSSPFLVAEAWPSKNYSTRRNKKGVKAPSVIAHHLELLWLLRPKSGSNNLPESACATDQSHQAHDNRRRRTSSSSSGSRTRERRAFRPTYSDEEVYFIWYHRIDLGYDWQDINRAYNAQFPDRPRQRIGGIQCKYYRYCEEFGVPKVRNRDRAASAAEQYGMRSRTGLTFPWMMK